MKRILIILAVVIVILAFPIYARADDYSDYLSSFDLTAFDDLDSDTRDFLNECEVDSFSFESISNLSLKYIVTHVKEIFLKSLVQPLKSMAIMFVYVILSSYLRAFNGELKSSDISSFYSTLSSIVISIFVSASLTDCITTGCSTIKLVSDFSYAFFPAFCIIVAASGGAMTSFSVNTLLLTLAQGLNYISELVFIPLTNCFLALGITASVRSDLNLNSFLNSAKKLILTLISTLSALFISVLSLKTAVSAKADALGIRSARFAINTVVPVIGPSISEGLISIQSYSSLIKTSVGIVGIISVFSVFLPAMCKVIAWRFVLFLSGVCADVFDDTDVSKTLCAFKDTLMIIQVVLILTMLTTIISIGVLVAARTVE